MATLLIVIFWPMLAAIAAYLLGKKSGRLRDNFVLAAVTLSFVVTLYLVFCFPDMELRLVDRGAWALHFRLDGFRALYGCTTAFLWLVTTLFSPGYFAHAHSLNRYWFFNLLTLGATMGVFFSADFRTTFLFFELMSLASYALVAHDETPAALRAAETYLAIAIIGGLAMLMGMLLLQRELGTLEFAGLYELSLGLENKTPLYLGGALLTLGFGAKAGMFPLHVWLPKAHPIAPAPASALLSGILIKTGVFGVAAVSSNLFFHDLTWGVALLIPAVITMVLGALLAVFSNDLKRILACSSVSQIGFILTGITMHILLGTQNALAVRGALLHMLNHSLAKLVLFTAAGVVYMNRHELRLDKIRGFGRGKPLFLFVFLMASFSICGLPFWSGYISKTLLHESIVQAKYLYQGLPLENYLQLTDVLFLFTGGLTFVYMAKLFAALFIAPNDTTPNDAAIKEKPYISRLPAIALAFSAALLPLAGFFPALPEALADWGQNFFHGHTLDHAVSYFTPKNLKSVLISLAYGVGIYIFTNKRHALIWPEWLDLENLIYRPLIKFLLRAAAFITRLIAAMPTAALRRPSWEDPATIGAFSLSLLFAGAGICIALVYVFAQALLRF